MRFRFIFSIAYLVLLSAYFSNQGFSAEIKSADGLSPRESYALAFDFVKGRSPNPFPSIKEMGTPSGLDDVPRIYRTTASKLDYLTSEKVSNFRPSYNMWPYSLSDIHDKEVDVIESRECFDHPFHFPLSKSGPFDTGIVVDSKVEIQIFQNLAGQFSDFIKADASLREVILKKGTDLFNPTNGSDLNIALFKAWKSGKLQRPAIMIPRGECSPDWASFRVKIKFKSDTSRLFVITLGDFKLCKIKNVNPWDIKQCPGGLWEITNGAGEEELYGNYLFKSVTSNGISRVSPIRITGDTELKL